ncbi:beta-propeller fold lactonase family protein [Candidatus Binatus sp.]|uniref:lactonase family protein n=1 Tax=Candidatus Binatus sp. TaxID=2811406 RepID=UPI00272D47D9|nr:beta-propeller fold lactonase family protein [Candidatus Binatus sp.]
MLRNFAMLMPALLVMAVTLNTASCGSGGLLTPVSSNSGTPTSTATSNVGGFGFVTNFNDAKVSSLTRNTTTGALKRSGTIAAGAKKGPHGLAVAPSNAFLYVANVADDNIYEFAVSSTNGTLTALSPASISNGNGSGPDQLAMNSGGSFLWATGSNDGTVAAYTVDTSTGQLAKNGAALGGFNTPFGIAVNSSGSILYVADAATGEIWPLTIGSDGKISKSLPAAHSADVNADTPGFIAIDSAGASLFVADQQLAEVSSFSINSTTGALTAAFTFQNSNVNNSPIGIGIGVNTGVEFLFTANRGSGGLIGSISSFVATGTTLTTPPTVASGYNGPIGLAVDPLNKFVYAADSGDGTVSLSVINGTCGSSICTGPTIATENPANASSAPYGIVLSH